MAQSIPVSKRLKTILQFAIILWTIGVGIFALIAIASDTNPVFAVINGVLFILGTWISIAMNWRIKIERIPEYMEPEFTYTTNVNIPKPSTSTYGYVYIIQDISHTGQYKIGRAIHPGQRLNMFAVKLPIVTKIIHVIPCEDYIKAESMLHNVFADVRGHGEWFSLTDKDIQLLKGVKKL